MTSSVAMRFEGRGVFVRGARKQLAWTWAVLAPVAVGIGGWLWNVVVASEAACKRGEPLAPRVLLGWAALLAVAVGVEISLARRESLSVSQALTPVLTVGGLGACAIFVARALWFIGEGCAS